MGTWRPWGSSHLASRRGSTCARNTSFIFLLLSPRRCCFLQLHLQFGQYAWRPRRHPSVVEHEVPPRRTIASSPCGRAVDLFARSTKGIERACMIESQDQASWRKTTDRKLGTQSCVQVPITMWGTRTCTTFLFFSFFFLWNAYISHFAQRKHLYSLLRSFLKVN